MQYYVKPNDVYLGVTRRFVCFSVRMPSWEPFSGGFDAAAFNRGHEKFVDNDDTERPAGQTTNLSCDLLYGALEYQDKRRRIGDGTSTNDSTRTQLQPVGCQEIK